MKKPFAVFTIAKDESVILPIWLKHYRQTFSDEDIYVLDHETKDGSTTNTGVNVIPIFNSEAGRHYWLVEQAQKFQAELLEKYEVVIYTDADEIIYSNRDGSLLDALEDFRNSDRQYVNVIGYESVHIMDEEKPLDLSKPIIAQRQKWSREPVYDKPLLTKIPLAYSVGFHQCQYPVSYGFELYMLHLHRMDYDIMLQRHVWKNKEWNLADEGGLGWQNRIHEAEAVKRLMKEGYTGGNSAYTTIPLEHQTKLAHL